MNRIIAGHSPAVSTFSLADDLAPVAAAGELTQGFGDAHTHDTSNLLMETGTDQAVVTYDAATSRKLQVSGSILTASPAVNLVNSVSYKAELGDGSVKDATVISDAGTTSYEFSAAATAASLISTPIKPSSPGRTSMEYRSDSAFAALRADGSVVTWGDSRYGGDSTAMASQLSGTIDVVEIFSARSAFAALRADGSVVTWGYGSNGGDSTEVASQLNGSIDVVEIFSTYWAFAALRADGSVVTWGSSLTGGNSSAVASQLNGSNDVVDIFSTFTAFAALRADGSVVTWGASGGANSSDVASQLNGNIDVIEIFSTYGAFAALRADGSVVTWGDYSSGGDSSAVASQLNGSIDVVEIFSTISAFSALRADGSVVTWGSSSTGGDSTAVASQLNGSNEAVEIYSTEYAFAALRTDGSVVTWGSGDSGGNSSAVAHQLNGSIDVIEIVSTNTAFAALRADGSVVTWGGQGGNSSAISSQLDGTIDVVEVFSTGSAFAALRADGSVVTWGFSGSGGNSSAISSQLDGTIDVVEIFSTASAFAALRADGSVVTWGSGDSGGNSSAVASQLDGSIPVVSMANPFADDEYTARDGRTADEIFNAEGYYQTFFALSAASYFRLGFAPGVEIMPAGNGPDSQAAQALKTNSHNKISDAAFGIEWFRSTEPDPQHPDLDVVEQTYTLPTNAGQLGFDDYQVAFQDGYYVGYTEGLLDTASVALVGRSLDAIFIAFRGTDSTGDLVEDAVGMARHYERYRPLFSSIDAYLLDNQDIKNVYVSGHSLGGQMAMMYLQEHEGDARFEAVTFEAANKFAPDANDTRFVNFEMRADPVPDIGLGNNFGTTIHLEYETAPASLDPLATHYMFRINEQFADIVEIIEPQRGDPIPLDRESRIYVDDNLDGVIVTQNFSSSKPLTEAAAVAALGTVMPVPVVGLLVTGAGVLLAGVAAAISYEDTREYWATGYDFKTSFETSDGILVLRPFLGISGGTYRLGDNVKTVIAGDDQLTPSENIAVNAATATTAVVLIGNSANNVLIGGSGHDYLFGGADKDILIGGDGNDTLFGGLYRNSGVTLDGVAPARRSVIDDLAQDYSENSSVDPVDVGFYIGGYGADRMIGELSRSAYSTDPGLFTDNDGDNDYFFVDVDLTLPYGDTRNVDDIENFYVAGLDASADDWLVFSAEQLGLSVSGDLATYFDLISLPFGLSGYQLDDALLSDYEERFFKVSSISEYIGHQLDGGDYLDDRDDFLLLPDDPADLLFAFVLDTTTGGLYFDPDGNTDFDDARLVATISRHPNGDELADMHADQIVILRDFDFVENAKSSSLYTGKLIDGYIAGATIYLDANSNGIAEAGEDTGIQTDANGNFELLIGPGLPIVAVGGTNIDTGLPNTLQMTAPAGATVVSPLTTLVQHTATQRGVSAADAQTLVQTALGIPAEVDLVHFDPLAQAPGDVDALAVQQVAAQVATLATLAPEGGTTFASLAASLATAGEAPLDLADAAVLQSILPDAPAQVLDQVAAINQALGNSTSLTDISAIQAAVATDTTPPTAAVFSPDDGATGVAVASNIVVGFSEAIQRGSGAIVLKTAAGTVVETYNTASSAKLSFSGSMLTINPTVNLAHETQYIVEFPAGSLQDLVGNDYAGTTSYDFTTAAAPILSKNDNFVAAQFASPAILGSGPGNDTYLLAPSLLPAGTNLTLTDTGGANSIQLAPGLDIASSRVGANAAQLTLTNGSVITVLGASQFSYEAAGNASAGVDDPDVSYAEFAQQTLGVTVPTGSTLVTGAARVVGGAAPLPAFAAASKSDNFVVAEYASPAILGSGPGEDTYLLSPSLLPAGVGMTLTDTQGTNSIQLADGLSIASSRVAANALQLILENGSVITVLGAAAFGYETGGNRSAGVDGPDASYASFALQILGVTVPTGSDMATGGPVVIGGASAGAMAASLRTGMLLAAAPQVGDLIQGSSTLKVYGPSGDELGSEPTLVGVPAFAEVLLE